MKRLLPLVLAIASAAAADPVVVEVPRAGGPLRLIIEGGEFAVGGKLARPAQAGVGRQGIARAAAAVAAPGGRVGLVARLASRPEVKVVISGRVAMAVPEGSDAAALAASRGLRVARRFDWTDRFVLADPVGADVFAGLDAVDSLRRAGIWAEPELRLQLRRMAEPTDPLYGTQWHLKNLGVATVPGGVVEADINIQPHWAGASPQTGSGINIAVVDDGIDLTHPDLVGGIATTIDDDFVSLDGVPAHDNPLTDGHGTVVAGLIGARANAIGGVGVAYGSSLVPLRIFEDESASLTDAATALGHRSTATSNLIHVSNNSWGVVRDGVDTAALDPLTRAALVSGVDNGRGGRGTVYVFSAGNQRTVTGGGNDALDWTEVNGNRYVIAVGAFGPTGAFASYSEPGIGLLLSAPGGLGPSGHLVSTDWQGDNGFQTGDYTQQTVPADTNGSPVPNSWGVQGTSFSAPLVSAAVGLLIEANPLLSWRDVPHILAHSATPISLVPTPNPAGLRFTNDYGAGRLDVTAALALAATWTPLPPATSVTATADATPLAIADNSATWVGKDFAVTAPAGFTVERAEVTVSLTHPFRGDVEFRLIAPSGTTATVTRRPNDDTVDLDAWTFSSVQSMGETGTGTWRIEVRDQAVADVGTLDACSLTLHGYQPYAAPTLSAVFPSAVLTTQPTTTVSVNAASTAVSEGGDLLGGLTLGATVNAAVAKDAAGWPSASIPAATFAAIAGPYPATVAVSLTNPQVRGLNYALAGGGSGSVNLIVRTTNAVPAMASVTNGTVVAGNPTTSGAATFTDGDGDTMRYRLGTAPAMGTATVDLLTGVVTYTPTISSMGSDSLTVIATDGMGDSTPVTISYEVERNVSYGLNVGGSSGGSSGGDGGGGGCGAGAVGMLAGLGMLLGLRRRRR
jgi:subtilisin family serine protease